MTARRHYVTDTRSTERAYSRAVVTTAGQTASASADFDSQTREVFARLDATIKSAGGSGLRDMVTMTVFINDPRYGDRFVALRKEIFGENFPASALITVSGFARPGVLIEIQGVAVAQDAAG